MTIEQFLTVVGPTIAAVVGLLWYMQRREDKMWKQIAQVKEDMNAMKTNYITRFQSLHDVMQDWKVETLNATHELEKNLRSSIHGLREDIAKFLGKMEAKDVK